MVLGQEHDEIRGGQAVQLTQSYPFATAGFTMSVSVAPHTYLVCTR